tara:strand:- start:415 stop:1233 length:819 start_codon:yes stop_codon:yes gene_type:complete
MSSSQKIQIQQGLEGKHLDVVDQYRDVLPNFIIIGAAKSATTTLTTILPKHPDIFISKPKEPKFFGLNYNRGWEWYASLFMPGKSLAARGEASTMYASRLIKYNNTAELMHLYLPKLKLIYIVRHPLDRIVSQWRHRKGRNPNTPDFNVAMKNPYYQRLIIGCSMYYKRLSEFRKFYPDEQIHCLTFEDLLNRPRHTLKKILLFLEVDQRHENMLNQDKKVPLVNEAGEKGREYVEKPEWVEEIKEEVVKKIRPDARKMLAYMGKPRTYWKI